MARGHQKLQSQQKTQEKSAAAKKQQGHSAKDQKKAAQAALTISCSVCKSQMPDPKTYKQHFENKHPKADMPAELKDVVAWYVQWQDGEERERAGALQIPYFRPLILPPTPEEAHQQPQTPQDDRIHYFPFRWQ